MKTILIFTKFYLPGYKAGGPIKSIKNLSNVVKEKANLYIVTKNHDARTQREYDFEPNIHYVFNKENRYYLNSRGTSFCSLKKLINKINPDIIYLNSFFDATFSLKIYIYYLFFSKKIAYFISPRGELSDGALSIKSNKKQFFLHIMKIYFKFKKVNWIVSSTKELKEVKEKLSIKPSCIHIAPNIIDFKEIPKTINNETSHNILRIVFLSRITKKKNLAYVLNILRKINCNIIFDIYGPISSNSYWSFCLNLISEMNKNINISYKGIVEPENCLEVLSKYDLFFFPTYGENFGHVIYESLNAVTPVLTSDNTPWTFDNNLFAWDFNLNDQQNFIDIINELASDQGLKKCQRSNAAMKYSKYFYENQSGISAINNIFGI